MQNEILNLNLTVEQALDGAISALSLNNYGLFYVVLKKHSNFHFFSHLVQNSARAVFFAEPNSLQYQLIETLELKTDIPGIICYEFFLRVTIKGEINEYDDRGLTFSKRPFELNCIACVHHFSNCYGVDQDDLKCFRSGK